MPLQKPFQEFLYPLAFLLCLVIALGALWPGITGPFLFDDFVNLEGIGHFGGLTNFDNLRHFVFGNTSSLLGRPLAMLSFAINDQYWPGYAWSFKYTNILLHLLNGVVLCALVLKVTQVLKIQTTRSYLVAITTMLVWLLHPLNVSTALYVVQRMTELMTLFVFAGLWCYVHGRQQSGSDTTKAYLWMSAGIGAFGLLAVLSKENGALLPLYALVLEFTLLRNLSRPQHWRIWAGIFLFAPLLLLVGYIGFRWDSFLNTYAFRDFTPGKRLMTESRVLFDYLGRILIPNAKGSGLYHDDYFISKGLLNPTTTIASMFAILGLLVYAISQAKKRPIVSFAILWFFAGHLMESTILPLDIYYEHRNYVPMAGIVFVACFYAITSKVLSRKNINGLIIILCLFISHEFTLTRHLATEWGDSDRLHAIWAEENPASRRAQQQYTQHLINKNNVIAALQVSQSLTQLYPNDLGSHLLLLETLCLTGQAQKSHVQEINKLASRAKYDPSTLNGMRSLRLRTQAGQCSTLSLQELITISDLVANNPAFSSAKKAISQIQFLKGELYAQLGQLSPALDAMDKAFDAKPTIGIPLRQAVLLASAGVFEESKRYLQIATLQDEKRNPLLPSRRDEIARFESYLQQINTNRTM